MGGMMIIVQAYTDKPMKARTEVQSRLKKYGYVNFHVYLPWSCVGFLWIPIHSLRIILLYSNIFDLPLQVQDCLVCFIVFNATFPQRKPLTNFIT